MEAGSGQVYRQPGQIRKEAAVTIQAWVACPASRLWLDYIEGGGVTERMTDSRWPLPGKSYRVLARRYRPNTLSELIGQDTLVATLTNAFSQGRLAQAFLLTGIRGVGKTTTARIIARTANCAVVLEQGGTEPCGGCASCRAIAGDSHADVVEMDAASHTGVDDVRRILDNVHYPPVSSRYKIYIIDEVHMLSRHAFSALLKILEEPPDHLKFVFATTEVRKIPSTIVSRCQRFDLKRVGSEVLAEYFGRICQLDGVDCELSALGLLARSADGSVRDGLSLLDQAITRGNRSVKFEQVRDMLGVRDQALVFELLETVFGAQPASSLAILDQLSQAGVEPQAVLKDLLECTYRLTRFKVIPAGDNWDGDPEGSQQLRALSSRLSMPVITRGWQMLLKGVEEVQSALLPQQALEMVVIRLAYVSDRPAPDEIIRRLQKVTQGDGASGTPPNIVPREHSLGQYNSGHLASNDRGHSGNINRTFSSASANIDAGNEPESERPSEPARAPQTPKGQQYVRATGAGSLLRAVLDSFPGAVVESSWPLSS